MQINKKRCDFYQWISTRSGLKSIVFVQLIIIMLVSSACDDGSDPSDHINKNKNPVTVPEKPVTPPPTLPEQPSIVHGDCVLNDEELALLQAHNKARAVPRQCGNRHHDAAPPVTWNCTLAKASHNHSTDMATINFFSHTGSDGLSPFDRITNLDYQFRTAGENIAAGQRSAETVVADWLKSPGHCANMMNERFTQMGGARVNSSTAQYSAYWTVVLATPRQ